MSDAVREGLTRLSETWRAPDQRSPSGYYGMGYDEGQIACADELDAFLLSVSPQPEGWQPIETAPKDGTSVLIVMERGGRRFVGEAHYLDRDDSDCGWWWAGEYPGSYHASMIGDPVTHWMPLPAAPVLPTPEPETRT